MAFHLGALEKKLKKWNIRVLLRFQKLNVLISIIINDDEWGRLHESYLAIPHGFRQPPVFSYIFEVISNLSTKFSLVFLFLLLMVVWISSLFLTDAFSVLI